MHSEERPEDYDDKIEQIIPTYDENEKTFKPPEFSYRMGMKLDSYENFKAWGYISTDQRMLLSDEGEVYLRMDEQTFGFTPYIAMVIRIANGGGIQSTENRLSDLNIGLKKLVHQKIRPSVLNRVIMWLKRGRLSKGIDEE
tara:strand:- start:311 stop:733 length:423 start_codon:yes stop_codon:yes gene_type:complete